MSTVAIEELARQIFDRVKDLPELAVVVMFGSRARGTARPSSDLDVAVLPQYPNEARPDVIRRRLQQRLEVELADLSSPPEGRVDVVFLDQAPETIRQRVMEHGRMVLCRDPAAWHALRVATMREHADRAPYRRLYRRALRRRLIEGRPSGRSTRTRQPLERTRRLPG